MRELIFLAETVDLVCPVFEAGFSTVKPYSADKAFSCEFNPLRPLVVLTDRGLGPSVSRLQSIPY